MGMFKKIFLIFILCFFASAAYAYQSTINPAQPVMNTPLVSKPVRDNFAAAYYDINNIYSLLPGPSSLAFAAIPLTTNNGGTGMSTFGSAYQCLQVNSAGTALVYDDCNKKFTYPAAGIPYSTGSAWGSSYNSSNPIPITSGGTGNTSGTAVNISATSNSTLTTLSALSLPYSQLTNTPSIVNSINTTSGAFTFTGSGVSCSGTTCTFSGGGGGGSVSGVAPSVNGYLPIWIGTTATSIGTGFPVGTTGNSTVVETNSGGTIASSIVPTLNQNTSGSAGSLNPGANINGVAFTGTTGITVTAAAGTLTGSSLASGVTASSLTSFGNSPALVSPTVTTSFTATGLVTNADLVNSATTVNSQSCTLGSSCTVAAAAGTLTGTTLNSTVVNSSLTSLGTIATGVWNGSIIPILYGGTGTSTPSLVGGTNVTIGGSWPNQTVSTTGLASVYLGTSASTPNLYGSATDTQTGLYTAGIGQIDFTSLGTQSASLGSSGLVVVGSTTSPYYLRTNVAPCDLLSSGCVSAWSVTRKMKSSYSGNLFKVTRSSDSTTQNIGINSNGYVDTTTLINFCISSSCTVSEIYDQVSSNNLIQATAASQPTIIVGDSQTLPYVLTSGRESGNVGTFMDQTSTSGLPIGSSSKTIGMVSKAMYSDCCGGFGMTENPIATDGGAGEQGEMFNVMYLNANSITWYNGAAGTWVFGADLEGPGEVGPITPVNGIMMGQIKYNSSTNKVIAIYNGNTLALDFSGTPQVTINTGSRFALGSAGDGTPVPAAFYEGFVTNYVTTAADDKALYQNQLAFYNQNILPVPSQLSANCSMVPCAVLTGGVVGDLSLTLNNIGTSGHQWLMVANSQGTGELGNTGGLTFHDGSIGTTGADRMAIGSSGNVTILNDLLVGTTTDAARVSIVQPGTTQLYAASTGAHNSNIVLDNQAGGNQTQIVYDDAGVVKWVEGKNASNQYVVYDAANSLTSVLQVPNGTLTMGEAQNFNILAGSGNTGIGTATPGSSAKLAVNGAATFGTYGGNATAAQSNGIIVSGSVGIGTPTPASGLELYNGSGLANIIVSGTGDTSNYSAISLYNGAKYWLLTHSQSQADAFQAAYYNGSTFSFPFTVLPTGNIGIGTTIPASLLSVYGGGLSVGTYVSSAVPTGGGVFSGDLLVGTTTDSGRLSVVQAGATEAYFASTGAHDANVTIDDQAGSNQSLVLYADAGSLKWVNGKNASNQYVIYDQVNSAVSYLQAPNGSLTLGEAQNFVILGTTGYTGIGTATIGANSVLAVNGGIAAGTYANTATAAGATNEIITSGSVGIGSASPAVALDISGNEDITGTAAQTALTILGVTSGTGIATNSVTTGTAYNATGITTGTGYAVTATTTGVGFKFTDTNAGMTTAEAFNATGTHTMTSDNTGMLMLINPTYTMTAAATRNISGAGNMLEVTPTYSISGSVASTMNMSGPTVAFTRILSNTSSSGTSSLNVSGDMLDVTNPAPTRTNAVVDTAEVVKITQSDTSASGAVLDVENSGTGNNAQFIGGNVSIGTTVPNSLLSLSANTSGLMRSLVESGTLFNLNIVDGSAGGIQINAYGNIPALTMMHAVGTNASPTSNTAGNSMAVIEFGGYNGTAYSSGQAKIVPRSHTLWTTSNEDTDLEFYITPTGTTVVAPAFEIYENGSVTIGTTYAGTQAAINGLQVQGNVAIGTTSAAGALAVFGLASDSGVTDTTACYRAATGQFYFGSGTLGICLGTSSLRYKNPLGELDEGLKEIVQLKPVKFYYKNGYGDNGKRIQVGFYAEDVIKVIPKLVHLDDKNLPSSVDYVGMIPITVKAIQEQQKEIEHLKATNDNVCNSMNAFGRWITGCH